MTAANITSAEAHTLQARIRNIVYLCDQEKEEMRLANT